MLSILPVTSMPTSPVPDVRALLRERFGFADFRAGQAEVISALVAEGAALAVFPTGAGKSLCYQLPALLFEGVTLVVSPLIALMKDQIDFLRGPRHRRRADRLHARRRRGAEDDRGDAPRHAEAPLRRPRALQQRALRRVAARLPHRALRGRRGALHLGVGSQLPPGLPQARGGEGPHRRGARPRPDRDGDSRRREGHLQGVPHPRGLRGGHRLLPAEPAHRDDAGVARPEGRTPRRSARARGAGRPSST